jgi:hypothetical protein
VLTGGGLCAKMGWNSLILIFREPFGKDSVKYRCDNGWAT